ncbi:MAG: hypothetical protein IT376_02475 [Polyangiaceae bacterium]|nr:hypothetical protein [Polyangiaceae bacterium]
MARHRTPLQHACRAVIPLAIVAAGACGRTDLGPWELAELEPSADAGTLGEDAAADATLPVADATPDAPADAPSPEGGAGGSSGCTPAPEECNGLDDDCNGVVDDGLPAEPCPGGGARYCVAGRLSECPKRCEVCIPGSERVCQVAYCLYWGVQTCSADGRSFGVCREQSPPAQCKQAAKTHERSAELEQCCIDAGYCCRDEYDLDRDGDKSEHLGACEAVTCE